MIIKLKRYKGNPILEPNKNNSWESVNVSNAGATIYDDKVYLLYRAEGQERRRGENSWPITRLGLAISKDGFNIDYRYPTPVIDVVKGEPNYEEYGIEDPRISKIGDIYYIVYVAVSRFGGWGDRLALATTKDFKTFKKEGFLMPDIEQRTSCLLPEKINGEYVLFHRIMPNAWISYSKDFREWHNSKIFMKTKIGTWYEKKMGIGAPPIKTPKGWLLFYHGVDRDSRYSLGIALLDLNKPFKIIKNQEEPILTAEEEYERKGFCNNVVYTCGAVEKNGQYLVYYGCADRCLSVATVSKEEINEFIEL